MIRSLSAFPVIISLLANSLLYAEEKVDILPMQEIFLHEDFETDKDSFEFLAANGKYTINFKGITDEKSFSGKKSFKLDITFHEGSYGFWLMPFKIPAEGQVNFSARILVDDKSNGKAGIGLAYQFPPIWNRLENGSRSAPWMGPTSGNWERVEADIGERASMIAASSLPAHFSNFHYEKLGKLLEGIAIYITPRGGNKNEEQRIILYIDDVRLNGKAPGLDGYMKLVEARWQPVRKNEFATLEKWKNELNSLESSVTGIKGLTPEANEVKRDFLEKTKKIKLLLEREKNEKAISKNFQSQMLPFLRDAVFCAENIKLLNSNNNDFNVYTVNPMSSPDNWILPDDRLIPGKIDGVLEIQACPGEYEPASFVVRAEKEIANLKVNATELQNDKEKIPSSAIDIKAVKCWFQGRTAGNFFEHSKEKILVPELLLNDDSLVKVDRKEMQNYVKLSFPEGEKYECVSNTDNIYRNALVVDINKFPVKDSKELQAVNIPTDTNKQFFLTIHVPENSVSGKYKGKIILVSDNGYGKEIAIELNVLPFKLLEPYYTSSLYYDGVIDTEDKGSISGIRKSKLQYRKEMENLLAHGVTAPVFPCRLKKENNSFILDPALMVPELDIRAEFGMLKGRALYLGGFIWQALNMKQPKLVTEIDLNPEVKAHLQDMVRKIIELAKSYGMTDVYFYGLDEAKGKRLTCQREAWEAIREAGGKIFVAGYAGDNFKAMGDIQDLLVCAGWPFRKEAEKWHSQGHKIWCYGNPQGGLENAEINRRNFGLLLWKNKYDGAATWIYMSSGGNTWNDFNNTRGRSYNFAYPTMDGVIDTIQWEGYREGVDDIRYVRTLEDAIERAKSSNSNEKKKIVSDAETFLEEMDVYTGDIDLIRGQIIEHILKLN